MREEPEKVIGEKEELAINRKDELSINRSATRVPHVMTYATSRRLALTIVSHELHDAVEKGMLRAFSHMKGILRSQSLEPRD